MYEATWDSLAEHAVPEWFEDAKLGIFIHWGLYSVPGWAPPTGELGKVDWQVWFEQNPYAEWYLNGLRIAGSTTARYHAEAWGEDFDYLDFVPLFDRESAAWDARDWTRLFREVGARYVVLTTKHHDGFTLWPSSVPNPNRAATRQHAARDLVGDLAAAVRADGMRLGLYYSGGLDWSFESTPIRQVGDLRKTAPQSEEYGAYVLAHYHELIERYRPDVLWNDISYPQTGRLPELIADYYNRFPGGLVNNRFGGPHADFTTPEYRQLDAISQEKWEACRGLGYSFGFNRQEGPEHTLSARELVHLLIDVVSKNGNLLLNVGPMADGRIPDLQVERLRELGAWLAVNGEGIFATRPHERWAARTEAGTELRFTRGKGEPPLLYVFVLDPTPGLEVELAIDRLPDAASPSLLGHDTPLPSTRLNGKLRIELPEDLPSEHAVTLVVQ